ncbi:MAG: NAD(P)-dependent oxidoreductase [Acidobacteriota bacterium]|nr:NAD(P)-dependent oxidoreductase [Acidobacteriota bacterium]MDQ7088417.1 NAD(P)-dependent oxidoreductase [Acidobacteriota bacterium]
MRVGFVGQADYFSPEDRLLPVRAASSLNLEVVEVEAETGDADARVAVIHSRVAANAAFFERWPRLEVLITTTSGWDHVDLAAAAGRGVRVARCPLARRDAVVETSLALGLSLLRGVEWLSRRARDGAWARGEIARRTPTLARGTRIGVVGCGVIGRRAVECWRLLGAEVSICDPALSGGRPLEEIARSCSLLTLHCSLTPASRGMIDERVLELMAPGSVLINTARGALVDLEALRRAEHLGGIGLDVFPTEPYPELQSWAERENVIVLPHAAGCWKGLARAVAEEVGATLASWIHKRQLPYEVTAPTAPGP